MADKLMYIPNVFFTKIIPSVYFNLWFKRLDFDFNKPANQNPQSCEANE